MFLWNSALEELFTLPKPHWGKEKTIAEQITIPTLGLEEAPLSRNRLSQIVLPLSKRASKTSDPGSWWP